LNHATGDKQYRAGFLFNRVPRWSKKAFKTATQAYAYGQRVMERYNRLRDTALAAERPHKTEEF
jgi:hypothetical protein